MPRTQNSARTAEHRLTPGAPARMPPTPMLPMSTYPEPEVASPVRLAKAASSRSSSSFCYYFLPEDRVVPTAIMVITSQGHRGTDRPSATTVTKRKGADCAAPYLIQTITSYSPSGVKPYRRNLSASRRQASMRPKMPPSRSEMPAFWQTLSAFALRSEDN